MIFLTEYHKKIKIEPEMNNATCHVVWMFEDLDNYVGSWNNNLKELGWAGSWKKVIPKQHWLKVETSPSLVLRRDVINFKNRDLWPILAVKCLFNICLLGIRRIVCWKHTSHVVVGLLESPFYYITYIIPTNPRIESHPYDSYS